MSKRIISCCFEVVVMVLISLGLCCLVANGMISSRTSSSITKLSYNYYDTACPQLESIVSQGLGPIFLSDPTSPASLLRLLFHDCQVKGCDASILLNSGNSEMGSRKNFAIKNRETIGIIKSMVDEVCHGQVVSCADILVLAARDAVASSGGPKIRVPLGRKDSSTSSSYKFSDSSLPSASSGVDTMLHIFTQKGMTIEESVAILGAHTLGVSHCVSIIDRLHNRGTQTQMRTGFELFLELSCSFGKFSQTSNSTFVTNDLTAFVFDNQFYKDAVSGGGVLKIDAEMVTDPRTGSIMERFSLNQEHFFEVFASAFIKLSTTNVLTGNQGVIRDRCDSIWVKLDESDRHSDPLRVP